MSPQDQAINLIQKSHSIGIALPEKPGVDESASFFALSRVLAKLKKETGIIFSGEFPKNLYEVLPKESFNNSSDNAPCEFIIAINNQNSPVKELRYEHEGGALNIILTPKEHPIKKEDISFRRGKSKFDAIITLGVHNLEDLGRAFEESPEMFYENQTIAIDPSPNHGPYAEISLTDMTQSSVSEITADLLLSLAPALVDENTATALLFGMINKTKNFQNSHTKPSTLRTASSLVQRGAKKDDIVRILWKTKPLPLLQIWGRASVRSRLDQERGILWSVLTKDDFAKTKTAPEEAIPFVIDHIEEHFSLPETLVLLWQKIEDGMIQAILRTSGKNPINAEKLAPFESRENCQILKTQFKSFPEAEIAITALLGR
ncbi:MAG: hypothetical protein Q7R91_01725 [bacterium]|nr:hypothetical protein [bacterium]